MRSISSGFDTAFGNAATGNDVVKPPGENPNDTFFGVLPEGVASPIGDMAKNAASAAAAAFELAIAAGGTAAEF